MHQHKSRNFHSVFSTEKVVNAKIGQISTENKRTQIGQTDIAKYHREDLLKLRCTHSSTRRKYENMTENLRTLKGHHQAEQDARCVQIERVNSW